MTSTAPLAVHNLTSTELEADEMTHRLGRTYRELCKWAVENGHQLAVEIAYHILGLDPRITDIGNLVHELRRPESMAITEQWAEDEYCSALAHFAAAVKNSPEIDQLYRRVGHLGGADQNRKQYKYFKDKTFLLTLITHPLADEIGQEHPLYIERRRLRIWLLLQATYRLTKFQSPADHKISAAARFLILDANDARWELVDSLLLRAKALNQKADCCNSYSLALANAAGALNDDSQFSDRALRAFLNAIIAIAQGESHPIEISDSPLLISSFAGLQLNQIDRILKADDLDTEEADAVLLWENYDEEDSAAAQLISVDITDSPVQQTLSSGSIFMQTMEMSHYLPWSWERVLPSEEKALLDWLETSLKSPKQHIQLGAACVWIAMTFGRSLTITERIRISSEQTDEWSLATDFTHITRIPPRRKNHWKPASPQELARIAPYQDELRIVLPEQIKRILQTAAATVENPESLGELWRAANTAKLNAWFGEQMKPVLPRLTGARLAGYQNQRLFDQTGEFNFARMLTSHPNSALPGACSYASWDLKAIEKGLQQPVDSLKKKDTVQAMGSLLVPLETVLHEEITRSTERLQQASEKGLIAYHNALAQYVVAALHAGTGARPIKDPFESLEHFSFIFDCVFINDKDDDGLHSGRLVPLPRHASKIVQVYIAHLLELAKAVEPHRPELAKKIHQLLQKLDAEIPLFFLLDDSLLWHSMLDAEKLNCALFNWGLPANLLRHRYSQKMLKAGVHPEVIEGWMGHAERGVATYSDYSARCWQQDAEKYAEQLQQVFEALPFVLPKAPAQIPTLVSIPTSESGYAEPIIFGVKARKKNRTWRTKRAILNAKRDILLFLDKRTITSLTDEDLYQLGSRMLLRDNGLPHPAAALRYRVYLKLLKREHDQQTSGSQKAQKNDSEPSSSLQRVLLRQRLIQPHDERSHITSKITLALEQFVDFQEWSENAAKEVLPSQLSKAHAIALGTTLLAIENRLGYQRMLNDILQGRNFRLVQKNSLVYVEYSESLAVDDYSAALQRHRISYKVGSLLGVAINSQGSIGLVEPQSIPELKPLLTLHASYHANSAPSLPELIDWICQIINLANQIQFPGILAAALSDRLPPTSESLRDHVRALYDKAIDLPVQKRDVLLPSEQIARVRGQERDKSVLQNNAAKFTRDIRAELSAYEPSQAHDHAKAIEKICSEAECLVSSSMLMLGYWMADVVHRGKAGRHRKFQPYQRKSLTTYWSSLASVFQGLLYKDDLVGLDSDAVTDVCAQMLEFKQLTSVQLDYFGKRLQSFFRWARPFGVTMPEWSELAMVSEHRNVSPGLIFEGEYQVCLQAIQAGESLTDDEALMLSFVLLTTYRFGLRTQEAICLLRRDWCQNEDYTWVLVQNNSYRTLKSKASQRAIPLLFKLSSTERNIIKRIFARYRLNEQVSDNRPVLCDPSCEGKKAVLTQLAPRIPETLIAVLRGVTKNPELVLHHCRHTFYNRAAVALLGINSPLAKKLTPLREHEHIKKIVLGEVSATSRRSAMALARLMGHRYPSTGLKNYFHLATDWADELNPVKSQRTHKIKQALQVAELGTKKPHQYKLDETLSYSKPTLTKTLQCLRLVSLGMSFIQAGDLIRLAPNFVNQLQNVFDVTNSRIRFTSTKDSKIKLTGEHCPNALLESITDSAWQRLLHRAQEIDEKGELNKLNSEDFSHLQDLPYLVSVNRQVLMTQPGHCKLASLVLDLFQVPSTAYRAYVKAGSTLVGERMKDVGFSPEEIQGSKLDSLVLLLHETNELYKPIDYGGLVLSRLSKGKVRNGLDLATVLLSIGTIIKKNPITN